MAKIKLTKNEQKKQKDALKRFQRYLPTLMLKKQQLQLVIRQVEQKVVEKEAEIASMEGRLSEWIGVFGETEAWESQGGDSPFSGDALGSLIRIKNLRRGRGNIAGVDIPVFDGLDYEPVDYDLFLSPLWVDQALVLLKEAAALNAEIAVLREQKDLLGRELKVTTQRVNLFEKVKIPETRESIRKIGIYLGDQQTAAVVRGKMAKSKVVKVS
ncbi:MAG: V-type ATP synthase subunit D [Spirochaetales bacterium]|jgi:V/A-type H+-transporting ATPase subunit D|nr:V-type ATP synthase subunit D [Spirochaetales bacterium]